MRNPGLGLLVLALMLPACGDDDTPAGTAGGGASGTTAGGCLTDEKTQCMDYTGSNFRADVIKTACTNGGIYQPSGCPTAGLLGSCLMNAGTANEQTMRMYNGISSTPAELQGSCEGSGFTWIAP